MGQTQSIEAATEAQRLSVGPFTLRSSEKGALAALSKIVQVLLTKNNLFDLKALLETPEGCKNLFVVVSSTVAKEFQLLKFPDPRYPSQMATLSFMPRDAYPPSRSESVATRNVACKEITHFLIRLVTLAAAATASVSRNPNIGALLVGETPMTAAVGSNIIKSVRSLPSDVNFGQSELKPEVLEYLKSVFSTIDPDRPNLYRFGNESTYMVDVKRGVLYNARADKTPVTAITMELIDMGKKLEIAALPPALPAGQMLPMGYIAPQMIQGMPAVQPAALPAQPGAQAPAVPGAQQPAVPGRAGPGSTSSNGSGSTNFKQGPLSGYTGTTNPASNTGPAALGARGRRSRKTLRGRRYGGRRYSRRGARRGGAGEKILKVSVKEFPYDLVKDCVVPGCLGIDFYMDSAGNTYSKEEYESFQVGRLDHIPVAKAFSARVDELFTKLLVHAIATSLPRAKTELSKDRFKDIKGATLETYDALKDYSDTMDKLPTGSAPAPYRGFLLASRLSGADLTTMFCNDDWAGNFMTGTLAYSLLQALFDDSREGGAASPRSSESARTWAKDFVGAGVARSASASGSDVESFKNIRFADRPDALAPFCGEGTGPRTTNTEDDKKILIGAQRELRDLYDKHIADVVNIMRKVLLIRRDPSKAEEITLRLNEAFVKDPRGAVPVLEDIIVETRDLIARHYLAVEKVYYGALQNMAKGKRGFLPAAAPAAPATSVLNTVQARLEKNNIEPSYT